MSKIFDKDYQSIGKKYNPDFVPSEIPVIVKNSHLSSNQKLIAIKLLTSTYCNAFNLFRFPSRVIDKWQECNSHQDRTKPINFLIDNGFIKVCRYYSRKENRANTYKAIDTGIKRIAINSRFRYQGSYNALKGIKPPVSRQTFVGISNSVKRSLKGFQLYIKPIEAWEITATLDDINKPHKWETFLNTGVVTGWNKPSFRTDDKYKRISTHKPNIQGLPKIYRNTAVIPEAKFDVDYTSQHLYISIGLNGGTFIPEAWECLELATGLNKEFIKEIVNPYYFGQSKYTYIADKIGIGILSKDKMKNAFIRIDKVKKILQDKNDPFNAMARFYQEQYQKVIPELKAMKAQRPDKPELLMMTGAEIMDKVLSTSTNENLLPIYDGIITDTKQTAENLQDRMPRLADQVCNIPIPVKVTNLQFEAI